MRDVALALHVRRLEKSPCSKELAAQGNITGWCVNHWPRLTQATWRVGSWCKPLQLACPSYSIFQWPGDCHLRMHPACHDCYCKQGSGKSCSSQRGQVFSLLQTTWVWNMLHRWGRPQAQNHFTVQGVTALVKLLSHVGRRFQVLHVKSANWADFVCRGAMYGVPSAFLCACVVQGFSVILLGWCWTAQIMRRHFSKSSYRMWQGLQRWWIILGVFSTEIFFPLLCSFFFSCPFEKGLSLELNALYILLMFWHGYQCVHISI